MKKKGRREKTGGSRKGRNASRKKKDKGGGGEEKKCICLNREFARKMNSAKNREKRYQNKSWNEKNGIFWDYERKTQRVRRKKQECEEEGE